MVIRCSQSIAHRNYLSDKDPVCYLSKNIWTSPSIYLTYYNTTHFHRPASFSMRFEYSLIGAAVSGVALGQTLNIPTRVGSIVSLPTPSVISGSKDFGNKEYDRGQSCAATVEPQGPPYVFILEHGASLSNVIIGRNQLEGIQCKGACTLTNVWFREVCESELSTGHQM